MSVWLGIANFVWNMDFRQKWLSEVLVVCALSI